MKLWSKLRARRQNTKIHAFMRPNDDSFPEGHFDETTRAAGGKFAQGRAAPDAELLLGPRAERPPAPAICARAVVEFALPVEQSTQRERVVFPNNSSASSATRRGANLPPAVFLVRPVFAGPRCLREENPKWATGPRRESTPPHQRPLGPARPGRRGARTPPGHPPRIASPASAGPEHPHRDSNP